MIIDVPFLLHFRMMTAIQLKNIREIHRSEDNLRDAIYHNLPDLRNKKFELDYKTSFRELSLEK